MKTSSFFRVFFSLICLLIISIQATKAQWEYKHPTPTGNTLSKIAFANNNYGWLVGESGTILKTVDGGNTWSNQYYFGNDNLISLSVVDTAKIFILTNSNLLYKSNDGGNTWNLLSIFIGANASDVCFISNNEGWVSVGSLIQHTTDGGITWNTQYSISNEYIVAIKMESNGNVVAATDFGTLLHSADFGQNWTMNSNQSGIFNAMDVNSNFSVAVTSINNTLYKSLDNGVTWSSPINTPSALLSSTVRSIKIIGSTYYLLTTNNGEVIKTIDGGNTWLVNNDLIGNELFTCSAIGSSKIIVAGINGKIGLSTNSASTFSNIDSRITNQELWGVGHLGNDFYAVGDNGTIVKSGNNGQTWNNLNSGSNENLKSIAVINSVTAVAAGSNGSILRTTNGGTSWSLVNTGYNDDISTLHRLQNGYIYAVGNNDLILFSNDNGVTWNYVTTSFTGFQYNFTDLYFASNDTGFIATNSAEIITTDDGGQNWYLRMTGLFGQMTCLSFADGLNGWIGSNNGEIFYTDNGGQSWVDRSMIGFTGIIHHLNFINLNTGWAFTDQGIFKTIDGGISWTKEFSPCPNVRNADFSGNYSAIALGVGEGKILERNSDFILSVNAGIYCSGHEYTFGAFSLGNFNQGNNFIAELSDDLGNFDYPTTIASVSNTTINSITVNIPQGLPTSAFYKLRIAATNPAMRSTVSMNTLDLHDSPQGIIYASGNTTFNNGDSVILINISGAMGAYQWYKDGNLIPGATNDSLVIYAPGNYLVNINDGICDGNSNSIEVIVNGFSGLSTQNEVHLNYYPNPVTEFLTIDLANEKFTGYSVTNISGQEIFCSNGNYDEKLTIVTQQLSPGFYFLTLKGEKQSTLKFTKE
ncbi:MAG: YCF48-related protein [Bacteroidota bacterium]